MKRKIDLLSFGVALLGLGVVDTASALKLKLRQAGEAQKVVAITESELEAIEGKRASIKLEENVAQLAVLTDSGPQNVVLAYRVGKRLLPAKKVLANPAQYCADGEALAYTGVRGKKAALSLKTREEGDIAYHSGKIARGKSPRKLSAKSLTGLVAVDSDCLPAGNGLTEGLAAAASQSVLAVSGDPLETDLDRDGLPDVLDVDTDNDGILNNFDETYTPLLGSFYLFSNVKVPLVSTLNVNALGRNPTREEVDALTQRTTLAIEVKATAPQESELDCGSYSYCSAGGTGTANGSAFPGVAGGSHDPDGDGKGTITRGGTGDFQLATNLSTFTELNPGDTLLQEVHNATGLVRPYIASLQFAFRSTPAIKTLVHDPAGAAETYNISYPVSAGDEGTESNCISVEPNSDGDIVFDITTWRPQRKGISALGEADFVDIGNAKVSIDMPNEPDATGSTNGNGPNLCPVSSYSTSDPNLTMISDAMRDTLGDTDADVANTVNFQVDVTDCLASVGQALDSGEKVQLAVQFRNDVGDNAAQRFCIERP